jgi:mono/diheme cytochrome c family protein
MSGGDTVGEKTYSTLLTAAMGGVLSFFSACGSDDSSKNADPAPTEDRKAISVAEFTSTCDTRGGLVETHMVCSSANTCAGVSYNKFSKKLKEHTCAAQNTCAGLSCVELAKEKTSTDSNVEPATGESIFNASCKGCHVAGQMLAPAFAVYIAKGATEEEKLALQTMVKNRTVTERINITAFGTKGFNVNGTHYSNMPAFYKKLTVSEVKRVVEYIGTLDVKVEEFEVFGQKD